MRLLPKIWLFLGKKYCAPFCALFGQIRCAFEFRIINHSARSSEEFLSQKMVLEVIKLNVEDDNDLKKNTSDSTCQICNQQFKHLRSHIWKVHGERSWDCDYCDKSFKLAAHLKIHIRNVHKISDGLVCDFCHKTFLIRKCLEDHKAKSHGIQDRQRCKNCSQIFENSKDFRHHLVSVHGLTVYNCDLCQKFFKQKGNLRTSGVPGSPSTRLLEGTRPFFNYPEPTFEI